MDTEKLIKILMLTTSSSDGEALNAIRMANRMLKASGKSWQDIVPREAKPPSHDHVTDAARYAANAQAQQQSWNSQPNGSFAQHVQNAMYEEMFKQAMGSSFWDRIKKKK